MKTNYCKTLDLLVFHKFKFPQKAWKWSFAKLNLRKNMEKVNLRN